MKRFLMYFSALLVVVMTLISPEVQSWRDFVIWIGHPINAMKLIILFIAVVTSGMSRVMAINSSFTKKIIPEGNKKNDAGN